MLCIHCGKANESGTRFCAHCGTFQPADTRPPALTPVLTRAPMLVPVTASLTKPSRFGKPAGWAGAALLIVAVAGGVAGWGWRQKLVGEAAVRDMAVEAQADKRAAQDAARQLAEEAQRRVAAEKAAEAAEVLAAQALLDKHIAAEEARAQANARAWTPSTGAPPKR